MAAQALGVLAHIAALRAGLRRGQQVSKAAFLATQGVFSRWLWPLGPGPRPRSPSPEPSGEAPTPLLRWLCLRPACRPLVK